MPNQTFEPSTPLVITPERPLISFCLFAYKQEPFIREAVEGAFAQTYSPLEIILSDDCSPDRTFEIMQEMATAYRGPHKIILNRNEPNLGLIPHVNKVCLGLANGELLVMAAGDDISLPERSNVTHEAWIQNQKKPSCIMGGAISINIDGTCRTDNYMPDVHGFEERTLEDCMDNAFQAFGATITIHKSIFSLFGPMNYARVEDVSFIFRAKIMNGLFYIQKHVIKHRKSSGISTQGGRKSILNLADWSISAMQQLHNDITITQCKNFISNHRIDAIKERLQVQIKNLTAKKCLYLQLNSTNFFIRLKTWVRLFRHLSTYNKVWYFAYVLPEKCENLYLWGCRKIYHLFKKKQAVRLVA